METKQDPVLALFEKALVLAACYTIPPNLIKQYEAYALLGPAFPDKYIFLVSGKLSTSDRLFVISAPRVSLSEGSGDHTSVMAYAPAGVAFLSHEQYRAVFAAVTPTLMMLCTPREVHEEILKRIDHDWFKPT